jgi:hypothetical protein
LYVFFFVILYLDEGKITIFINKNNNNKEKVVGTLTSGRRCHPSGGTCHNQNFSTVMSEASSGGETYRVVRVAQIMTVVFFSPTLISSLHSLKFVLG